MIQKENKSLISGLDKLLYSNLYPLGLFIITLVLYILKLEVIGVAVLLSIMVFVLVAHKDTMPSLYPFLLLCAVPLRMYASFDVWIKLVPMAFVVIPLVVFRFIYYRPKYNKGKMFYPYLAISIAVTLGGLFTISAKDYFTLTPLYYVVGLGFGMLGIYVLLNAHMGTADKPYELKLYLTKAMLWLGAFFVTMILVYYAENFNNLFREDFKLYMQFKNNLSTSLLITMPFAFYYSKRCKYPTLMFMFGILQYTAMFLSFSRSGILCGTIMVVLCSIYGLYINKKTDRKFMIACLVCVTIIGLLLVFLNFESLMNTLDIRTGETRVHLYKYAVQNFKNYPIFGTGLAHKGDFYHPQAVGLYWYHSSPFQIIASMGIVGIIAYLYQFIARIKLLSHKRNAFTACALLSFLGLQIISFVNPGEFCPLPYVLNIVLIFVVVEKELSNKNLHTIDC